MPREDLVLDLIIAENREADLQAKLRSSQKSKNYFAQNVDDLQQQLVQVTFEAWAGQLFKNA